MDTNPIKTKLQKFHVPVSKEAITKNSQPNLLWRFEIRVFKTPVESLYAEKNETPPKLRHHKLTLQYYMKLKSCPNNFAYNIP